MLELSVVAAAGLTVSCGDRETASAATRRRTPAHNQRVSGPAAPSASGIRASPCVPSDIRTATEVPFEPNDRAFGADSEDFEVKRAPKPGDWMARFHERGLTFDEYVAIRPTQRQGARDTLVLQPLGRFRRSEREQLAELVSFTEAFFDTKVRLAPVSPLPKGGQRVRNGAQGQWVQHHTQRILDWLVESKLPRDAVCVLGITMEDLYPEPSWNYVFGEATLERRAGVYSLARYQASFWGERATAESRVRARLRSFKVLAHETGHMFSLPHCRRYECLMNGSNSLEEMDRAPLEPCPVCLKMLQYNLRFAIRSRYRRLMAVYERNGLVQQANWVKARLERIGCGA